MEGEAFDWKSLLQNGNFEAVGVSCFKHAPSTNTWDDYIVPGIKLVIRHQDVESFRKSQSPKSSFWVVTVIKIQGYFALVRYLGMEGDASQDFWILMGKHEIYPVGGEIRSANFIPPQCILQGRVADWRTYFVTNLSGSVTIPSNFLSMIQDSCSTRASKYKVGDKVEVLDKYNISQFRIGRVNKIVGCRLYLQYLDDSEDGFFCHEQSSLIHSLSWAICVGHKIKLPAANCPLKPSGPESIDSYEWGIKEGMKLEAIDPLCPSRICAATICKVLEFGYVMVKMDCYDDQGGDGIEPVETDGQDSQDVNNNKEIQDTWFCYHIKSPHVFRCGFCEQHGISIVPPLGYKKKSFSWSEHLEKVSATVAPIPEKSKLNHGFKKSMKLEMADVMNPSKIYPATITQIVDRLLRISFDGWGPVYDQWLDAESPDIYPIGWSALVGHGLLAPSSTTTSKAEVRRIPNQNESKGLV